MIIASNQINSLFPYRLPCVCVFVGDLHRSLILNFMYDSISLASSINHHSTNYNNEIVNIVASLLVMWVFFFGAGLKLWRSYPFLHFVSERGALKTVPS